MNAECEPLRERLSEYLDGALPQDSREALEAHLAACAECREELELLRRVVHAVGAIPGCPAPDGFAERVVGRVGRVSAAQRRSRAVRLWFKALPVAAMFLVVVATTFVVHRNGLFQAGRKGRAIDLASELPVGRAPEVELGVETAIDKEMEERGLFVAPEPTVAGYDFASGLLSEEMEATSVPAVGEAGASGTSGAVEPPAAAHVEVVAMERGARDVGASTPEAGPRGAMPTRTERELALSELPPAVADSHAVRVRSARLPATSLAEGFALKAAAPEEGVVAPTPGRRALGYPPDGPAERSASGVRPASGMPAAARAGGVAPSPVSRGAGKDDEDTGREVSVVFQQVPQARVVPHQVLTVDADDPVDLVQRAVALANANELTPALELTTEGALGLQLDVPQTRYVALLRQLAAIAPPERQDLRNSFRAQGAYFADRLNDYALFPWIASPDAQESVGLAFRPPSPAAPRPWLPPAETDEAPPATGAALGSTGIAEASVVEQEGEVRLEILIRRVSATGRSAHR
jgi:anti-sigma factor (TIGR02949 family)